MPSLLLYALFPRVKQKELTSFTISITLDAEIIEKIKTLAEQDDRSFSQYVNLVLKEYLKENKANIRNKTE